MELVFAVMSYDSIECCNRKAIVRLNGLYKTQEEAYNRQNNICGGNLVPTYRNSNAVCGANGYISWIKKIPIGDLNNYDVNSPCD